MSLKPDKSAESQKPAQAPGLSSQIKKGCARPTIFFRLKLIIMGLFCLLCSNVLHADYNAADLNKLFTDKKQRARIDATRSGKATASDVRKQTRKIKVSGYLTRSDGKNVVWINNKNTIDNTKVDDVFVHQSSVGKGKKVTMSIDGKKVRLKPGETWHKESGKIVENR